MSSQNQVYECSKKNASIQISNSEWINEWNDGIKLNKGDSVRLLGSFISETGDGNDISITEDVNFTMNFKPYLNAETVRFGQAVHHGLAGSFQMKLGDIAQPAYYTDNFGTEPPYTTAKLKAQAQAPTRDNHLRLVADRFEYNKTYGHNETIFTYGIDDAKKAGAFIDTSSASSTITAAEVAAESLVPGTLSAFNQLNVPHEYHIAHLCKLVKLPLFTGIKYEITPGVFQQYDFDVAEVYKVGDYISTYHIGNYPTIVGSGLNTPADYQTVANNTFGKIKWEAGPQSVVGKIVATKFIYEKVFDPITNQNQVMEFQYCYVQDFINPGQYKHKNDVDNAVGGRPPRHGASEYENGYNTFRNNNRLNGITNALNRGGVFVNAANPTSISDVGNNYLNQVNQYNIAGNEEISGATTQAQNMENNTNTGLSFLWGGKGSSKLSTFNHPNVGNYIQDACTSWVFDQSGASGVWSNLANGTNMLDIALGQNVFIIGTDDSFTELRTTTMNINSFVGGSATGNPYFSGLENIEEVAYQSNFFDARNHYYRITTNFNSPGAYAAGTLDIHYQRNVGGYFYRPLCFTYGYGEEIGVGSIDLAFPNSGDWKDVGGITTLNPDNDNVAYNTPANPAFIKRYSVPYNQQKVKSPYTTRNYGMPGPYVDPADYSVVFSGPSPSGIYNGEVNVSRLRHIFGTSPAWLGEGDIRSTTNRTQPFPYGLGATPPFRAYLQNAYNEQCLSVYFQNDNGDMTYTEPNDDNDIENNILWKQDLIYIKTYKSEFTIPAGFYAPERMADIINDQLHFDTEEYKQKVGNNSNVGSRERALSDGNNVIHGNFIHTYIPELSYGFLPMTPEAYQSLNSPSNFNVITHNINNIFKSYGIDNLNPVNVSASNDYDYYTVPYTHNTAGTALPQNNSLYMFRLIGSRILQTAAGNDMSNINPSTLFNNRIMDTLASNFRTQSGTPNPAFIWYQNRGYKNRLMYGGAAKCWVGAVNPTFQYDMETQLFNWTFLYTPYRPAADESGNLLTLTGGEAIPSAIINTIGSGEITESLSGIYIESLTGTQISATNTPQFFDQFQNGYPAVKADYIKNSTDLWNKLGFSNNLLATYNLLSPTSPYLFLTANLINGSVLRNQAEVDISANGANPLKSYCNLWCPPVQFAVIVESNQKFGDSKPKLGNTPFYLIGSSFPTNEYYGGKGTKLPIIGICSRQFSSFGFAFDLSESSITLTIDQDCTITSIRTKIYNNNFTVPTNLDDNSSVIYVIERNNYYPEPTEPQLEAADKEIIEENAPINYTPSMFEYVAPTAYTAPLYLIDSDDEDLE